MKKKKPHKSKWFKACKVDHLKKSMPSLTLTPAIYKMIKTNCSSLDKMIKILTFIAIMVAAGAAHVPSEPYTAEIDFVDEAVYSSFTDLAALTYEPTWTTGGSVTDFTVAYATHFLCKMTKNEGPHSSGSNVKINDLEVTFCDQAGTEEAPILLNSGASNYPTETVVNKTASCSAGFFIQ